MSVINYQLKNKYIIKKHYSINSKYNILQRKEMYPLKDLEVNTIKALCFLACMPFTEDNIRSIATTLPVKLYGVELTLSRVIQNYRLISSGTNRINAEDFILSADWLVNLVFEIDQHTQMFFGYYSDEILKLESQMIIPRPINILAPMEELCRPLKCFLANFHNMQYKTIGAILFMAVIQRVSLGFPKGIDAYIDWSGVIYSILSPYTNPASIINDAGCNFIDDYHREIEKREEEKKEKRKIARLIEENSLPV